MIISSKVFSKYVFVICAIIILSSSNLFAQRYVKEKLVKQGLWKNNWLDYVSGELRVFVNRGTTIKDVRTRIR